MTESPIRVTGQNSIQLIYELEIGPTCIYGHISSEVRSWRIKNGLVTSGDESDLCKNACSHGIAVALRFRFHGMLLEGHAVVTTWTELFNFRGFDFDGLGPLKFISKD